MSSELKVDNYYLLNVSVGIRILTYSCKILEITKDGFITIKDKYGEKWSYNKNNIISYLPLNKRDVKAIFGVDIDD